MKNLIFSMLLFMVSINIQASELSSSYEYNCNGHYIIKYCSNGAEERITLQPGENAREKIRELRNLDQVNQTRSSNNGRLRREGMQTIACFVSDRKFADDHNNGGGIPVLYQCADDFHKLDDGTDSQCHSQLRKMAERAFKVQMERSATSNDNN